MDPGPHPRSRWGPAWFPRVWRSRPGPGALLTLVRLRFRPGCRGLTSGLYPHREPQRPLCRTGQDFLRSWLCGGTRRDAGLPRERSGSVQQGPGPGSSAAMPATVSQKVRRRRSRGRHRTRRPRAGPSHVPTPTRADGCGLWAVGRAPQRTVWLVPASCSLSESVPACCMRRNGKREPQGRSPWPGRFASPTVAWGGI